MRRCPLCHNENTSLFYQDKKRCMYLCHRCQLVFSDATNHLPPHIELQRYQSQTNKYQKPLHAFLKSLALQCLQQSNEPLIGLNFGRLASYTILADIESPQLNLYQYDPFFAPDHKLLRLSYDFIGCYRVFEHFRFPIKEWTLLGELLKPGGWLAINTKLLTDIDGFGRWHHKNNPTHVSFYQRATFEYLAQQGPFKVLFAPNDLILVQKTSGSDIKRG